MGDRNVLNNVCHRLKDLEIELRDVIIALKDVPGTQWYDLGLQVRLSPSTLDTIAADHQTSDDRKRMMLNKWLKSDPEASWEKLAAALTLVGQESTAAAIKSKFSPISSDLIREEASSDSKEEDKIREFRCMAGYHQYNVITASRWLFKYHCTT